MKLLTNGEIHALLTKFAYDVRYKDEDRVQWTKLGELCDLDRGTLDNILERGWVQEKHRLRISTVLLAVDRGEVKFTNTETIYTDPPRLPPQAKLLRLDEWKAFAPCASCAGTKWATVFKRTDEVREFRVCVNCIPPEQYKYLHLDTNGKRDYKRVTENEGNNIGHNQGVPLQRLRERIRVNAARRGGQLPSLLKRRGREGI